MNAATLKTEPNAPEIQQASDATEIVRIQNGPALFEREDWTLFRSLNTLPQKAGVPLGAIPRLVCKELADNALDASGDCRVGLIDGRNGFYVEDGGDGIPGTDDEIARLYSIRRPLTSSKLIRLPTRGALGNGLRVVAGAVLASRGTLTVATGGRILNLIPRDDGGTDHEVVGTYHRKGARIEVGFGSPFQVDRDDLSHAESAIGFARLGGPSYRGKTSPHWYDADGFWELCQAGGERTTVRELIAEFFEGCSEPRGGKIASIVTPGQLARTMSRTDSERVLSAAKAASRTVNPKRLGYVGPDYLKGWSYAKEIGEWTTRTRITAPVIVEVWVNTVSDDRSVAYHVNVNRTPITTDARAWIVKDGSSRSLVLNGCSARMTLKIGRLPLRVVVNIDTPFMPITTDGKTPDLRGLTGMIEKAVGKAANRLRRSTGGSERTSQKGLIVAAIPGGAAKMSGDGALRFSLRQLFYAVREAVKKEMPAGADGKPFELNYGYFTQVVTDYEAEHGDIPGMYRDPRGMLYHPHTREEIPLGTVAVENYKPPEWTFNKLLYCEKEGFTEIMKSVGWPERNDCALVSSKGYASRAVRDVFDLLGETEEEITFFCVHDADAYGTMILQSLREATKARGARKVQVVNLGLEPGEAQAMGLEAEAVSGDQVKPVADYVEPEWRDWLQTNRVELNAMTTRQFIDWLDAKVAPYAGKVMPPADVMANRLTEKVEEGVRRVLTDRVLAEAGIDAMVERAVNDRTEAIDEAVATITGEVASALDAAPQDLWSAPVDRIAGTIARAEP